jgi:ABC-type lipoprotein release transport system permease subunit
MRSIQYGAYDKMISNLVDFSTGYIQIQNIDYLENRTLDYHLNISDFQDIILPKGVSLEPRIESGALCSNGDASKPLAVLGIDPTSNMAKNLLNESQRKTLTNEHTIWLGKGLEASLQLAIQDTVWLLGQGAYGSLAAAYFIVQGFLDFKIPELNNRACLMGIENAQDFYMVPDGATGLIALCTKKQVSTTQKALISQIDTQEYAILSWEALLSRSNSKRAAAACTSA